MSDNAIVQSLLAEVSQIRKELTRSQADRKAEESKLRGQLADIAAHNDRLQNVLAEVGNIREEDPPLIPYLLRRLDLTGETVNDKDALDKIALTVRPWDGEWSDADGILESIGNIVESTGRVVDWEYAGEDLGD